MYHADRERLKLFVNLLLCAAGSRRCRRPTRSIKRSVIGNVQKRNRQLKFFRWADGLRAMQMKMSGKNAFPHDVQVVRMGPRAQILTPSCEITPKKNNKSTDFKLVRLSNIARGQCLDGWPLE
jgi:hypothetical protein